MAHTTWFFESFVLREFLPGYRVFNKDFEWLFNSYYQSFSAIPEKKLRASFSRPGLAEVLSYRQHVDEAMERLLNPNVDRDVDPEALRRIELGVNHEEQHQELLLTDILNAFFTDPLKPAYFERVSADRGFRLPCLKGETWGTRRKDREQGNEGTRERKDREQGNEGTRDKISEL